LLDSRYSLVRPCKAVLGHKTETKLHPTIEDFDRLPDDAVVPRRITAALLHMSERTVRRCVPTVQLSARRRGNRVGDIRAIARGDKPCGEGRAA
jgi:hypothetical protein